MLLIDREKVSLINSWPVIFPDLQGYKSFFPLRFDGARYDWNTKHVENVHETHFFQKKAEAIGVISRDRLMRAHMSFIHSNLAIFVG